MFEAARVLIPSVISFSVGIIFAPILAHYLYHHKAWKKKAGKGNGMGNLEGTPLFDSLHETRDTGTPRMGGVLIWGSVLFVATLCMVLAHFLQGSFAEIDFVNRGQTWLPLFALLLGGVVGFIDDLLEIRRGGGGLRLRYRLIIVTALAAFAGWWFYDKLEVMSVGLPFFGSIPLGIFFIPFFIFVTLAIYAGGVIDGIDGLAGGVFAFIFMAYAGIAFSQEQIALAAFAASVSGALFAFLWFNIPPARFYMSETGSMALTLALAITAFSTDTLAGGVGVGVLPIIALPLAVTVLTNALQVISKKFFKKKLFRIAPIHHHFEAIGWPSHKVTMRYWVITIIAGILGLALALLR